MKDEDDDEAVQYGGFAGFGSFGGIGYDPSGYPELASGKALPEGYAMPASPFKNNSSEFGFSVLTW